jgi:hypothetical protein
MLRDGDKEATRATAINGATQNQLWSLKKSHLCNIFSFT